MLISALLCMTIVFTGNFVSAQEILNITLLGDSITTGFGLSEEELSYGDYLESYFEANVENFAVNGLTTEELIENLNEQETIASVSQADLVCVSIGGNDFLSIFQEAMLEAEGIGFSSDGKMNISSDFVSKFVMDYSAALGAASVKAGENISVIKNRIAEINPDAEIIMQTVYNPFESSDPDLNNIMAPLKTFAAMYITTINNSIKEVAPNTADIYLKFSEKPYLYTNIDSYDIHPNYIGHLLIAEEIVQIINQDGNADLFSENIYKIPQGVYSQFPEYMVNELNLFVQGEMRRGTLEQSIQRMVAVEVNEETSVSETEITEETEIKRTESTTTQQTEKKEVSRTQQTFSKIFMILGVILILSVTMRRFIKKKKKNN